MSVPREYKTDWGFRVWAMRLEECVEIDLEAMEATFTSARTGVIRLKRAARQGMPGDYLAWYWPEGCKFSHLCVIAPEDFSCVFRPTAKGAS